MTTVFDPRTPEDVRTRLDRVLNSPCKCPVGPHEDALHDLAVTDVPWLLEYVAEAERRGAKRGWDEGFAAGKLLAIDAMKAGPMPPYPLNPYRKGADDA